MLRSRIIHNIGQFMHLIAYMYDFISFKKMSIICFLYIVFMYCQILEKIGVLQVVKTVEMFYI